MAWRGSLWNQEREAAVDVRRFAAGERGSVEQVLARSPAMHAYLLGLLARGALADEELAGTWVGVWRGRELIGVACLGSAVLLSVIGASGQAKLEALTGIARWVRASGWVLRAVVGPAEEVAGFSEVLGVTEAMTLLRRDAQVLLEVGAARLDPGARSLALRLAELGELQAVMEADRAMVVEELGVSPFTDARALKAAWRRRIAEQRAWVVGPIGGPIQFKADVSAVAPQGVQVAGVYVAPALRGRGLATRALGELCHRLLREAPRVSLYVHAENIAAIRLYRRLGFGEVGRVGTLWFRDGR